MKQFNLMQIVPELNSGGVEQGTFDLANYIGALKNKNLIVSNGGRMESYLNKKYVCHHKLPVHSKNFFKMPFIAKKINFLIKENNINILHIRSRAPAWLLPYINKNNLLTVSTFHNVYGYDNFIKKIYNKALANTDHIVAISKYVKDEIVKIYKIDPIKITIINRGIDTEFYDSNIYDHVKYLNFIKNYNIPTNKKIILFPGRLTSWKGQVEFLNIINELRNQPYIFYFVGDNKNTNYSQKLIDQIKKKNLEHNCRILGHLDRENLKMMYHFTDLVISMPLKAEGFGRVISESLAMKKIVLAYNIGGAKDQLEDLDSIYKIQSNKEIEITKKIKLILETPSLNFNKIKEKSRLHVIKKFSKNQMLENYVNLYRKIRF